ncbi:MAG: integrin alpha, partial [Patescibacteria group bacterium]
MLLPLASPLVHAKDTYVLEHSKISELEGGLHGDWTPVSNFGDSVASLGDFDADGVTDYIVGAPSDNEDTGEHVGAVWILLMNADETVKSKHKISELQGGFTGDLNDGDEFGSSVTSLGDLD